MRLPDDRIHLVDDRDVPNLCAQHLLAVLLLDGALGFAAAHDRARMRDPAVLALRARIRLVPDAALTRALPPRQAIVEITTRDGRQLQEHARAVRGTPDNPMDRARGRGQGGGSAGAGARRRARPRACGSGLADRAARGGPCAAAPAAGLGAQGRYMPPLTWIVWPVM